MFYEDEDNGCCCGGDNDQDCGCDNNEQDGCSCGCDCGHDHDHGSGVITMTDTETGEEYSFVLADDFVYQDEHYCVLITADEDEEEPEMVITRVVTMDDGTEGLMSLDDDEYDRVYAEYERLCEEDEEDEEEDDEEKG
ncbi:MAG: DUF1292 domain-containing protein [Clostridiaceae bacterium]|jgi:hypothetical protein|nr:DUF1292 domain-containing protein [Clostridiales bacterium]MDD2440706.1 DUF1292 domain-containing protein [Eubacteriales bacterium]MDD4139146.1 DUF1292 domain-containing protein [Eubacteriales bacterium]MDD4743474.1 DUF1292 domain-containing protein [Eubacteriales bacterium]NLB44446.1 DUF1292 domain-containing protein [Clostridiaceae bacterium]